MKYIITLTAEQYYELGEVMECRVATLGDMRKQAGNDLVVETINERLELGREIVEALEVADEVV